MQEMMRHLLKNYGVTALSMSNYRDGYIIITSDKSYFIKKTVYAPDRIKYIHNVKEYLFKNNFKCCDRYLLTSESLPYTYIDDTCYVVSGYFSGKDFDFETEENLKSAAILLSNMHKSAFGFKPPKGISTRDDLGKMTYYFSKRLDEIKKLKKIAAKGKSKFDYLFIQYVDLYYNYGLDALNKLEKSSYKLLCEETREKGMICHHDFTHHNIIASEDGLKLINFDYCCQELRIYDLMNFIRRKMRKCNWDIRQARIILDAYQSVQELSKEEYDVMKILLQFPQKFWRVANKFYNTKRSWSEKSYTAKLQEVIDEYPNHRNFMDQL